MRRLLTLLMAASAVSWMIHGSPTLLLQRTGVTRATFTSAAGRKDTARLVRDAGLTLTSAELPHHIVQAVLVDVDADGDADLVANVGSLDLGVWINDGSGRLTRARASSTPAQWAPVPPSPAFEARMGRLDVTVPDTGASAVPPPVRAGPAPPFVFYLVLGNDPRVLSTVAPASSPRAPPLA